MPFFAIIIKFKESYFYIRELLFLGQFTVQHLFTEKAGVLHLLERPVDQMITTRVLQLLCDEEDFNFTLTQIPAVN